MFLNGRLRAHGNSVARLEVVGPAEARRSDASESGSASISCEFSTAAFATPERRVRRPGDRRSAEAAATIQQCFESVVLRHLYPRSEISIYIQVLQSDGGALCGASQWRFIIASIIFIHALYSQSHSGY